MPQSSFHQVPAPSVALLKSTPPKLSNIPFIPFDEGLNLSFRVPDGSVTAFPMKSSIFVNFSIPSFKPSQRLPVTFAMFPPKLVIPFQIFWKKPVPLAKACWLTPISQAVSEAFSTSAPAGNNILVLRPGTRKLLPFGMITISWFPVSGLSLPSFSVASTGFVIGLRC